MTSSGQDDTNPPPELQGLDPKDLLQAGLETVPPVTLPPQPVDSDATIPVARPQSTQPAAQVELPLPEELTKLLPGGNYHVESFLGQGGMGAVYKGMQVRLKRPVAIKIMRRDMGKDYDFEARFEREAQAMAKLNHPNIVSVIDFGEAGPDYLYIVMELIDGADLMDVIRGGQMTQEMALSLLPQVCDALQFAHDHGIVHRDIKPSNIMLTRDGRVKMCDFGLAKRYDVESSFRTQTGTGMGTPDYAAPEQFDPKANIDHRADIYALGVMIYQMITGQLPRGVWKPPSQRAAVAPQWDEIVSRAMQSDPSDRYQQASEVKTDVTSIPLEESRRSRQTAEEAAPAAPQPRALASTPTKSRAPLLFGLIIGAAVLAVGAFFALKKPEESRRGRQTAEEASSTSDTATPPRALASAPTPASVPALPESGWKPLVTKNEWETDWDGPPVHYGTKLVHPNRRFTKEGHLHIQNTGMYKPSPSADGAIRVESVVRQLPHVINLGVRRSSTNQGRYAFGISSDATSLLLRFIPKDQTQTEVLKECPLPTPIKVGDRLKLELRIQGTQLTGLWNGLAVLQAQDQRLTAAGEWGLDVVDASIQSVEVQPLPGGASMPPQGIAKIAAPSNPTPQWRKIEFANLAKTAVGKNRLENGLLHVTNYESWKPEAPVEIWQNGAVRTTLLWEGEANTNGTQINLRGSDRGSYFARPYNSELQVVFRMKAGQGERLLGKFPIQPPLQPNKEVSVQMAAIGSQLNVWVNDRQIGFVQDEALIEPGAAFIRANATRFKSFDVINLDGLPEDEALKILGAEVKGADLSGASATPRGAANTQAALSAAEAVGTATKDKPFTNTLGMKFVPVPIGGGPTKGHKVLFSVWHTRVQDYATYVKAQEAAGQKMDGSWKTQSKENVAVGQEPDHPVVGVSWEDAQAFCQWLTEKETAEGKLPNGLKYRMPTDEEWSWAVGLPAESGAKYRSNSVDFPWGKDFPPTIKVGNYADETFHAKFPKDFNDKGNDQPWIKDYTDGYVTTSPVGSFPANAYGLHDMGGNVWQWCEDWQDKNQKNRVLRGGSWGNEDRGSLLSSNRHLNTPATRNPTCGFRCVLSAETVPPTAAATTAATSPAYTVSSSSVKAATKAKPFINTLGMKFVPVPIGGGPTKGQRVLFGVWETRVKDYAAYVKAQEATGKKIDASWKTQSKENVPVGREPDHPVVAVSWDEAQGFCQWLTEKETAEGKLPKGLKYRLPSDEEWSWAVGLPAESGTTPADKDRKNSVDFPWGKDFPPTNKAGNYADESFHAKFPKPDANRPDIANQWLEGYIDGYATTSPVGSFPANAFGIYDMGGNVMEWCEDWYDDKQHQRALRDICWGSQFHRLQLLSSSRSRCIPQGRWVSIYGCGFRCVLSAESTPPTAAMPTAVTSPASIVSSSSVEAATKDKPFVNTLGMKFVPVPDTNVLFCIHETRYKDYASYAATNPSTDDSWKYQAHDGHQITERHAEHPVVSVNWEHAQKFCEWLSKKEGKIYRLPTDEEWSIAVGLGGKENHDKNITPAMLSGKEITEFPWGAYFPPKEQELVGNYSDESRKSRAPKNDTSYLDGYDDGYPTTAPVMSFKPNKFGLYDLGGNVWEWCDDWFDEAQKERVLRGGSWRITGRGNLLSSYRYNITQVGRYNSHGFRVVLVAVPAAADQSPASSQNPRASKSSDKVLPGQWVKLFTKADDLPTDLRMPDSGVTWKDGWLRFDRLKQARPRIELPAAVTGKSNYAVRLRGIGSGKPSFQTGIILRRQTSPSDRHYQFSPQSPVPLKIVRREGDAHFDLARLTKPLVQAGEEYTMEFVALGNYLIGRYNMEIITARDDRFSEGTACISGTEDIRDIEVINLDSLPEADALKILGVDEKGNDLRGKTTSASSPSSPAAAAVATQFALGEWVRPFKDITSIHETWIKAGATWVDGWITPGPGLNHSITLAAPNGRGKNWGVRACYRWQEKGGAALLLRRGGKAADNTVSAYQLKVESSRASFSRVQGNGSKQGAQITELGIAQPMNLEARDEVVIEAFALGNMLYGRVDGQIVKVPSDGQLSSGDFEAAARLLSYRDIEFINLDGLPEAEALRLLGVDEQGKDLRGKAEAAAPPADAK